MLPLLSILVNFAGNSTAEVLLLELGPGAAVLVRGVSIDQATCLCVDREAAASFGAICLQTYTGCTAGRTESTTKGLCSSAAAVQQCRRLMRRAGQQSCRASALAPSSAVAVCERATGEQMSGSVSGRSGHAASQCRQGVQSVAEVLRQLQLRLQSSLECRSDGYYCCQHRPRQMPDAWRCQAE